MRGTALKECVESGTGILPVGFCGIGILPMIHRLEADATMRNRLLTHAFIVLVYSIGVFGIADRVSAQPAGSTHPFSVRDMLAMDRITDPQVSPDGKSVAFVVRQTDLEANCGRTDLWLVSADGTGLRRLTSHPESDSNPRWSPGQPDHLVCVEPFGIVAGLEDRRRWRRGRAGDAGAAGRGQPADRPRRQAYRLHDGGLPRRQDGAGHQETGSMNGPRARPPGRSTSRCSCGTGIRGKTAGARICS